MYRASDPWGLDNANERARFVETNRRIEQRFGKVGHLLELGCGEGAQSLVLAEVCERLTGLDVSTRAIQRARARCPDAQFEVGAGEDIEALFPGQRFDLITACEVLYYSADPAGLIASLQSMSDQVFVTVYDARFAPLEQLLNGSGWEQLEAIEEGDLRWICRAWSRKAADSDAN
nr:class I SAM-dependent methyltransferase [Altererythrobacter lutimaris]